MKVILLQELKGKGGEGDVVEVTRGFAVNYLLPKKIAIEATKGNLKQLELRKHNIAKREAGRLDTADKIFNALNESVVTVRARVGEEGQLFGSVTSTQIAEAIREKYGVEVDRKKIEMRAAIKTDGEHPVLISIYRDVKATVIIKVIDEKAVEETEETFEASEEAEETTEASEVAGEIADEAKPEAAEQDLEVAEDAAKEADEEETEKTKEES